MTMTRLRSDLELVRERPLPQDGRVPAHESLATQMDARFRCAAKCNVPPCNRGADLVNECVIELLPTGREVLTLARSSSGFEFEYLRHLPSRCPIESGLLYFGHQFHPPSK